MWKPKVGMLVKYEVASRNTGSAIDTPRWNYDLDQGSSGRWATAPIVDVGYSYFSIRIKDKTGITGIWNFSIDFLNDSKPGGPRPVDEEPSAPWVREFVFVNSKVSKTRLEILKISAIREGRRWLEDRVKKSAQTEPFVKITAPAENRLVIAMSWKDPVLSTAAQS